jgi:hypothetical protein
MNTDTPETDEALSTAECESDLVMRMRRIERERDELKRWTSVNGVIDLQRERDEARDALAEIEDKMRIELRGHPDSELWGDAGLIAATMRCVDALDVVTAQRDRLAEALRLIADGTSCRECGGEDQALFARQALQSMICDALQSLTPKP